MSNFIVQFPLITEIYQEDILNRRFELGRKMYNSLVTITKKRYTEMTRTKLYRSIKEELTEIYHSTSKDKFRKKELRDQLNELYKKYKLNEYSFHNDIKLIQKHFKDNIDSFTSQKIATNLWKSYDKLLFGKGKAVHYKRYDTLNSLEGKANKTGIRFKNNILLWNGLKIPVDIDYNNLYEYEAMQNEIAYCRIVRKYVRNKYKFYLQIVFKGIAPVKLDKKTGEIKRQLGSGDVGLDIGTQTIAIASDTEVKIFELADKVQNIENRKRLVQRKMDRSKRSMNPDNFNEDGTIKKQGNKKVKWIKSNHYKKLQNKLKELYRKQADIRKLQHEILANYVLSLGDNFNVETMNYAGLQKRSIKTEKNENGKFKKKKRFGKSLANKAPSMLLTIIDRKLRYHDKVLNKIDTYSVKASQYNHLDKEYKKKKLSERWNYFGNIKVQRDMYSAFLIMNVSNDLKEINQQKCNKRFNDFLVLHDLEVQRLTGYKNLSSIAI